MNLELQEVMLLLGSKELTIYEKNKEIELLKQKIAELEIKLTLPTDKN